MWKNKNSPTVNKKNYITLVKNRVKIMIWTGEPGGDDTTTPLDRKNT